MCTVAHIECNAMTDRPSWDNDYTNPSSGIQDIQLVFALLFNGCTGIMASEKREFHGEILVSESAHSLLLSGSDVC